MSFVDKCKCGFDEDECDQCLAEESHMRACGGYCGRCDARPFPSCQECEYLRAPDRPDCICDDLIAFKNWSPIDSPIDEIRQACRTVARYFLLSDPLPYIDELQNVIFYRLDL